MSVPNCELFIRDLARQYPTEFRNAHQKDSGGNWTPESWDFVKIVAYALHTQVHPSFGLNGKRGNPNDLSADAVNFLGEGPGHDPKSGRPATIIDFIGGAGGPSPTVTWNVINEAGAGAWVQPQPATGTPGGGVVLPPDPPTKPTDYGPKLDALLAKLDALTQDVKVLQGSVANAYTKAAEAAGNVSDMKHGGLQQTRDEVIAGIKAITYDIDGNAKFVGPIKGTIKPRA